MSRFFPVFLLDMDGVLVEPRGYRHAIQATLNFFTEKMGVGDLYPGEEAIARFESINMTNEWDILPILLAAILDGLVEQAPGLSFPGDLLLACQAIHDQGLKPPSIDPASLAAQLGPHFEPGTTYSDLALALNRSDNPQAPFPHLIGLALLENLLGHTRDVSTSLATSIFQHFAAGSDGFERAFDQPRLFDTESYLRRYDRPLLKAQARAALIQGWQAGEVGLAVYTARPSAPPNGHHQTLLAYSPEAELVLDLVGLEGVPLVGSGQLTWLASEVGLPLGQFIKPSPVHALAAIGAAVTRQVTPAMLAAERLFSAREAGYFRNFPPLSIHVFEDSGGNIRAVRRAGELLAQEGLAVEVTAWGIAASPAKQRVLEEVGATLAPDVNTAIRAAMAQERLLERS